MISKSHAVLRSGNTGRNTPDFCYDESGKPFALTYKKGSVSTTYYYVTNLQGDVIKLVDTSGNTVAEYAYDPYGKILSATGDMADVNPLRYRGYYYDKDLGFYYLQSRYYDPEIGRFISADSYASTGQGFTGQNMFAYCGNNPVVRKDDGGEFWDTIFDAVSLCLSVVEVIANPADPLSWVSLAGDVIDLVPFVTGVGETAKAVGATIRITNAVDNTTDTIKIVKAADFTDDALDTIKTLGKVGDATKSTASAGRRIHNGYKTGFELVDDMTKEAVRGRNRLDFLDDAGHIIYELKPFNPRGIRDGIKQLRRYNEVLGGGYAMVLEVY